jgi:hypothetical protein
MGIKMSQRHSLTLAGGVAYALLLASANAFPQHSAPEADLAPKAKLVQVSTRGDGGRAERLRGERLHTEQLHTESLREEQLREERIRGENIRDERMREARPQNYYDEADQSPHIRN